MVGRRLKATPEANVTRPKKEPVEVRNIAHPKVWKTALGIAGGKSELLTVIRYGEVSVLLG